MSQKNSPAIGCCVQIIDVGSQKLKSPKEAEFQREIFLGWELLSFADTIDQQGQIIYKLYPLTWSKESLLRKEIDRWSGGNLSEDQLKRFNVKSLLGQYHQMELVITNDRVEGTLHENLKIDPLPSDLDLRTLPKPKTPFQMFMTSEPDMELFGRLPANIQEKIKLSPEFEWAQKAASDDEYE